MHLKYAKMLAIALHENMKLEDNSLSNERLSSCKHKIFDKILVNCSPYFAASQYINNLETKRSYKRKVNLKNLKFFKKSFERFKNYSLIC